MFLGRASIAALAVFALGAAPAFAGAVFTDHTFNLANYSATPTYSSDVSASIGYTQCAACGLPGKALRFDSNFTSANGSFAVAQGLLNTNFSYDPITRGAIVAIGASVDKNIILDFPGVDFGSSFYPTIQQNGVFYVAEIDAAGTFNGPGGPGYQNLSNGHLLATDFFDLDFTTGTFGAANPDFAGSAMLFGLTQISGLDFGTGTITTQYDNLRFSVQSVPEPGTLGLLGIGFIGFGWLHRRKRVWRTGP